MLPGTLLAVGSDDSGNHRAVFYVVPPKALTNALSESAAASTEDRSEATESPSVILKASSVLAGYKPDDPLSNVHQVTAAKNGFDLKLCS